MHSREISLWQRGARRNVLPFEWGTSFISDEAAAGDPRELFKSLSRNVLDNSVDFYSHSQVRDYELNGEELYWTSTVQTPSAENNRVFARYFSGDGKRKRAVVILPHWNADETAYIEIGRLLNRFGISALRMTMPYHGPRRPPEIQRADYLVSPNIGRTIQSIRQAVIDARAAITWLIDHMGYESVGILGTSVGSCTAFLAFVHDHRIKAGFFNHVSTYFADVVWHGISTVHVRAGIGDSISLDELREYWLPISPMPYASKLVHSNDRPTHFIAARYDLTFPPQLSTKMIDEVRSLGVPVNVTWLPCGHYTIGEAPWKYILGWKVLSFFRKKL
jgi:hypothetical protein